MKNYLSTKKNLPIFESGAAKMQSRITKLTVNTVSFSIVAVFCPYSV